MVDVTKPILSVSCLSENGVETHLAKESFLRFGDGHEPLIRKGGVYFVKAADGERMLYELMDAQRKLMRTS